MGWVSSGGSWEWMSCTDENPPPNPLRYNADGYTTQESTQGVGVHAVYRAGEYLYTPCEYVSFEESTWGSTGDYMALYELDPGDGDDWVADLSFPDLQVTFNCPFGSGGCWAESEWRSPISVNPANVATAQIRFAVLATNEYIP